MAKEIRGHAMPDPDVYLPPRGDAPPVSQGNGFNSVFQTVGGGGPDAGPGYAFTSEQLKSIAGKWEALAGRYTQASARAQAMAYAEGPGAEYASVNNADKVKQSGAALREALEQRVHYCNEMADKFRAASGAYSAAEDQATAEISESGGRF